MKTARIYTNDFNRIIAATKSFTSKSNHRIAHQYIKLEFDAEFKKVTAIAVDGYKMSVEHAVISDCDEDFAVYIKSNVKLPARQFASLTLEEDEVIVRCGEFIFGYRQPKPDEFDWHKAIPTNAVTYKIAFNGNYMMSALQAAKVSCGDSFRKPVILEFRSPLEPIILRTNQEDIKMVLPIRIKED